MWGRNKAAKLGLVWHRGFLSKRRSRKVSSATSYRLLNNPEPGKLIRAGNVQPETSCDK